MCFILLLSSGDSFMRRGLIQGENFSQFLHDETSVSYIEKLLFYHEETVVSL